MRDIVDMETRIRDFGLANDMTPLNPELPEILREAKEYGFSDRQLSEMWKRPETDIRRLRKEMGMKKSSYHNVHMMLGAPGTAKTTVAKLMGKIMEEEKLLPGSQFTCVNGAELKGMYVGHSAPKTKALFEENDIIVIDEAYSLTGDRSEPDSFSREAIAQLVIELEEHAEDKLVIFAGYGGDL